MTPGQDHQQFLTDRAGWCARVAPNLNTILGAMDDLALNNAWAHMQRETQAHLWNLLDASLRERIRILRRPTPT